MELGALCDIIEGMTKRAWIVFIGILLVATLFRLWKLESIPPGLYHDEAMNGSNALRVLETDEPKIFYPDNNGREGLFINLQAISVAVFGNEPWALRLVSALFGIGTVAGVFFLTRALFYSYAGKLVFGLRPDEAMAAAASFFTAVSFWHMNFSRIGFRAIMAPFFLVWAVAFLWIALRSERWQVQRRLMIAGGAFFGLGFHSYIAYRVSPLLLVAPFFLAIRNKKLWAGIGVFLAAAAFAALPIGFYFSAHPADFLGRTEQVSIFASDAPVYDFLANLGKTLQMFWFRGDHNSRHNLPGSPELWWPIGILFVIGIVMSVWDLARRKNAAAHSMLWVWLLIFSLPVALSSEGLPHALRAIIMIPPVLILSAYGFWRIIEWVEQWFLHQEAARPSFRSQLRRIRWELGLLLLVFFAAHAISTYTQYFVRWASMPDTYRAFSGPSVEIARWLRTVPSEVPKYVIVNASGIPTMPPDGGTDAKKAPMPAQTIMFLTDTWPQKNREAQKLTYVNVDEIHTIRCPSACAIVSLETDPELRRTVRRSVAGLFMSTKPGFPVLYKGFSL